MEPSNEGSGCRLHRYSVHISPRMLDQSGGENSKSPWKDADKMLAG